MLFLMRLLVIGAILGGLGYGALWALGSYVEPESREMSITIPTPRPER